MQVNFAKNAITHFGEKLEQLFEIAKEKKAVANNEEFAALLGIHPSTLFRNFKSKDVKLRYMRKACEIAGVSEDFLYTVLYTAKEDITFFSEPSVKYGKVKEESEELKLCRSEMEKYKALYEMASQQIKTQNQIIELLQKQVKE